MSLLPAPVNQVSRVNNPLIRDTSSPPTISPRHQDGYHPQPSPPSPATDAQEDSPGSVAGSVKRTDKKPRKFSCQYCGRKFLRAEHLRRHEITHTGDKPFRCPYCKEAFSRSDILKRHIAKCRAATGSEHIPIEPETPNAPPRRACDRCARLKVRCDFVTPCSRCSRQQMDCTYHRLNTSKPNGSSDDRRTSQASLNGSTSVPNLAHQTDESMTGMNGVTQTHGTSGPFPGFRSSFSFNQNQSAASPPRMLPPPITSPSMGIYPLQQPSPQSQLSSHVSPPNMPPPTHDQTNQTRGISPFNTFATMPTTGPSLLDLSHAATTHQPVFSQNMDLGNTADGENIMFTSSDPSDMIFNNQFTADDTFFNWKPFEYGMTNDASLDFLFGADLGIFDIGYSPNDPQLGEIYPQLAALSNNQQANPNATFDDAGEKSDKEDVPDEGLVATFDPGTGDGTEEQPQSAPISRHCPRINMELGDGLSLIQVDPLQARVDALTIAVFGSVEALQQQDAWIQEFFTTESVKNTLFLWAKRWAQHVPIIHIPTFSILTAPDALIFVLTVIGKAYSRPGIDPERLQWAVEVFNKLSSMAKINGEWDLPNFEAVYIFVVLCTWHGNKAQRDMAKKLYRDVVDYARQHGYFNMSPLRKTDGSDEADWKAWIDQETRIRFMLNVYLMDGGYVVFFNTRPVLQYQEVQLPFACDSILWNAPNAQAWRKEMQNPRERIWLPQTLDAIIHASIRPEEDRTDLYGKFILIHGIINHIWDRQYELDCQTDPFPGDVLNFRTSITRALNNWRQLWDNMIPRLKLDRTQWARLGFFRNSLEYWYAAKLFLARPRRSGWGQPYDDDNNLFRVKRMLRVVRVWVVRGETKSGLSKRDLLVPNFLETLKVAVPELSNVRIEEAPSAVPSPRPIWNGPGKKEK